MSQIEDVVIVGGGAAGCAVSYYLAKAGVKSTIIERDSIAANASGYSAGGLNPLEGAGIPGPLGPLAIESYRMHREIAPELSDLSGVDFGYKVISSVRVAFDDSDMAEMKATYDIFESADDDFSAGVARFVSTRGDRASHLRRRDTRPGHARQRHTEQLSLHSRARQVRRSDGRVGRVGNRYRGQHERRASVGGADRLRRDFLRRGSVRHRAVVGTGGEMAWDSGSHRTIQGRNTQDAAWRLAIGQGLPGRGCIAQPP